MEDLQVVNLHDVGIDCYLWIIRGRGEFPIYATYMETSPRMMSSVVPHEEGTRVESQGMSNVVHQ